jgi:hypothetical protein
MSNKNKNYDHLDKILRESQEKTGSGGKVWVTSDTHPDRGYWAEPSEVNLTWERLKAADDIERYLRS